MFTSLTIGAVGWGDVTAGLGCRFGFTDGAGV